MAAIILAAGQGTRFGAEPKLLAEHAGKPLIRHVAEAALASAARPVVAVLGHRRPEVAAALAGLDLTLVDNPDYRDGLATSLKAGFARIGDADGAVVLLGDMPRVGAGLIDRLILAWRAHPGAAALVPSFQGQRGNPVLLSAVLARDIERLSGDAGAGPLLRGRSDVIAYPVEDPAVLQDVDTPAALGDLEG